MKDKEIACPRRGSHSVKKNGRTALAKQRYRCTDRLESYRKLLPGTRHWIGKDCTRHIERNNLNFRTHIKRL